MLLDECKLKMNTIKEIKIRIKIAQTYMKSFFLTIHTLTILTEIGNIVKCINLTRFQSVKKKL